MPAGTPAGYEESPAGSGLGPVQVFVNAAAVPQVTGAARTLEPLRVHAKLPGFAPTPLVSCPSLAADLNLGSVWVKDETWRLGLPAFKMLGASYAIYRTLTGLLGREVAWDTISDLRAGLAPLGRLTLTTATDGNHGRAVARMAHLLGLAAAIYVPEGTSTARIGAIRSEGATVTVVAGDYDAAVRLCTDGASADRLVISDTSWPGYTHVPGWVIDGYSTIFAEISDQHAVTAPEGPDLVVVPIGVGALAAAAVQHYKAPGPEIAPRLLGVEPLAARCTLESLRAGHIVTVPGPHPSIMAGLNCGTPSLIAWPYLAAGLDATVAVADGWVRHAVRELATAGIEAGETGAAALAGLRAIMTSPEGAPVRDALDLDHRSSVLLLCTEGPTDPAAWQEIVGRPVRVDGHGTPPAGPDPLS